MKRLKYSFVSLLILIVLSATAMASLSARAASDDEDEGDSRADIAALQVNNNNEGQNLLTNGGFESGTVDPWIFQNWPRRGSMKIKEYKVGSKENSRYLRVKVNKTGEYWMTQVRQKYSFAPQEYTLSFWARAEKERKIIVNAQEDGSWKNLNLWREPQLTEDWAFFTYTFTPQMSTNKGQIVFNMGDREGTVLLDEVKLTTKGAPLPPPPPPPAPGALRVSMSDVPQSRVVIAGSTDVVFANFLLDATGSGEDVLVNSFSVTQLTYAPAYPARFYNVRLYDGDVMLDTKYNPDPIYLYPGTSAGLYFGFLNPILVPKDTIKTLTLKGSIATEAISGAVQFGLNNLYGNNDRPSAIGKDSNTYIEPVMIRSDGPLMTLAAAGALSLSVDPSNPAAGLLVGNTSGITVGVMKARAIWEDIQLQQISFMVNPVNGGGPDQFNKLWLTDGNKVFSVTPTSSDTAAPSQIIVDISGDPILILKDEETVLTLKVDTSNVDASNNSKGVSGQGFQLGINAVSDVYALGTTSWKQASVSGTPQFNTYTLYRSVPTVNTTGNPVGNWLSGNGVFDLFRFTVSADQKGPIGIYKLTFGIATTSVSVINFELWDSSYTSGPVAYLPTERGEANPGVLEFLFDTDLNGTAQGGEFREVPAGTSRTFTLRGTVAGYQSSIANSISVALAGDSAFPSPVMNCAGFTLSGNNSCIGVDTGDQDDFIWSDFSHTTMYNSTTATNTAEWTNGYHVPGLPSTTSTAQSI